MEQVLTDRLTDVSSFLSVIRPYCANDKASFELSWTLKPGKLERYGRINYWIDTCTPAQITNAKHILDDLNAPAEVKNAFERFRNVSRIGFGFAAAGGLYTVRLYLSSHQGFGRVDYHESWRWDEQGGVKKHLYNFQFDSDISDHVMQQCIPPLFGLAFKKMTGDERFKRISGYWTRKNANGKTDNIYLALPWMPATGQLPGIEEILNDLQIPNEEGEEIMNVPVKNFGYKIKRGIPEITIYAMGDIFGTIPIEEKVLQQLVLKSAMDAGRLLDMMCETLHTPATLKGSQAKKW